MKLKLSVLNNINIKGRTWNKVANTVNPKSSSSEPLINWLRQSANQSHDHIKNASLLWKNKQD